MSVESARNSVSHRVSPVSLFANPLPPPVRASACLTLSFRSKMAPAKPAAERYDPTLVLRVFEDMCRTPHDVPIDLFVIGLTEVVKVVRE